MKSKKINLSDLSFNKEIISNLDQVKGGSWSDGCTDGCTGSALFSSAWNCTYDTCTADCGFPESSCVCVSKDGGC